MRTFIIMRMRKLRNI